MHAAALIGGLVELHPLFGRQQQQQQQYIESHITLFTSEHHGRKGVCWATPGNQSWLALCC
jgi:hypothetical protein